MLIEFISFVKRQRTFFMEIGSRSNWVKMYYVVFCKVLIKSLHAQNHRQLIDREIFILSKVPKYGHIW